MPNEKLNAYRFQRSFFEAGKRLPQRTRAQFYAGVLDFYFDNVEPTLPKSAADLFEGFRERIAMARSKALGAYEHGLAEESARDSGEVVGEYPAGSQRVPTPENFAPFGKTGSEVPESPPRVLREEKGELRDEKPTLGAVFLKDARSLFTFLDAIYEEVELQEAFDLMKGDGIERWLTKWIERGWRDHNERSLDDLVTDKNGELIERWRLMLRGLCEKVKRDSTEGGGWMWE